MLSKKIILHPFLFAIAPTLSLYEHNKDMVDFYYLLKPLTVSLLGGIIIFLISRKLIKNKNKAHLIASLFILLFFIFDYLFEIFLFWGYLITLLSWLVIFIAVTSLIISSQKKFDNLNNYFDLLALILVLWPIVSVAYYEYESRTFYQTLPEVNYDQNLDLSWQEPTVNPDIYYIIFDGYARQDILQSRYGYDNSDFINFLEDKGFYVADQSRSNYVQTYFSLASSLNFEYVNQATEQFQNSNNRGPIRRMLRDNKVYDFLKNNNYTFVALPATWTGTYRNTKADIFMRLDGSANNNSINANEFNTFLIDMTPLKFILTRNNRFELLKETTLFLFDHMKDIAEIKEPTFIYAHFITQHPPFIFDETGFVAPDNDCGGDGSHYYKDCPGVEEYREKYIKQLKFTNEKIKVMIEEILAKSETAPIIILQADHGSGSGLDWSSLENTDFVERRSIFNAYYVPTTTREQLYPTITPVNSFRVIFNSVFKTNLKILEDRTYFAIWPQPYNYIDITDW